MNYKLAKRIVFLSLAFLLAFSLLSLFSCAPAKLQGNFQGSFSLVDSTNSDGTSYRYTFYGDGAGSQTNRSTGYTVSFTYTAFDDELTVKTDDRTFSYPFRFKDNNLNLTYYQNGKKETVLLTPTT